MSIFSSLFSKNKTPSKSYVSVFVLLEENIKIIVFEKQVDSLVLADSVARKISREGYNSIGLTVEEVLTPIEKKLNTELQDVLFVVPSCALDDSNAKINQTYRQAIKQIVREFEFNALGYVDLFEVVEFGARNNDNWIYLERNLQTANIHLCTKYVLKKKLKVTSDADEICAHIEESSTKKSKIFYFTDVDHDDVTTFERNLAGYDWVAVSADDIANGSKLLLQNQLYEAPKTEVAVPESSQAQVEVLVSQNVITSDSNNVPKLEEIQSNVVQVAPNPPSGVTDSTKSTEDIFVHDANSNVSKIEEIQNPPIVNDEEVGLSGFEVFDEQDNKLSDSQNVEPSETNGATVGAGVLVANNDQLAKDFVKTQDYDFITSPKVESEEIRVADSPKVVEVGEEGKKVRSGVSTVLSFVLPSTMAILLAVLIGTLLFLHRAEVTLILDTTPFETEIQLSSFPVNVLQKKNKLFSKVSSTGTKEIGERAKGTVTFASFDDKVASFSAGTTIEVGSKVYKLDADVSIDPASLNLAQGTKVASKKSVAASATFIGPDGNLDKGTEMLIVGHPKSLYYAVAETAFAGGSRQTVDAVAKEDIVTLEQKLYEEAEVATGEAQIKLGENDLAFSDISKTSVDKVEFSASVGDAKTEVSATAVASSSIYYGSKEKILQMIGEKLVAKLGENAKFNPDNIDMNVKISKLSANGNNADMNLVVTVQTYQEPSIGEIQNKMVMKPISNMDPSVFDGLKVLNIRHVVSPNIFPFNYIMPIQSNFIKVSFQPDGPGDN